MLTRRALLQIAFAVPLLGGCKRRPWSASPIAWHPVDEGIARAKAENKWLLLFARADWDHNTAKYERETFLDDDVRRAVQRDFIAICIDDTDGGENPETEALLNRFKIIGVPTLRVIEPHNGTFLAEHFSFMVPRDLLAFLRETGAARPWYAV